MKSKAFPLSKSFLSLSHLSPLSLCTTSARAVQSFHRGDPLRMPSRFLLEIHAKSPLALKDLSESQEPPNGALGRLGAP